MKKFLPLLLCALLLVLCFPWGEPEDEIPHLSDNPTVGESETDREGSLRAPHSAVNYSCMRAIWLSQYDMYGVCTEGGEQRERRDFILLVRNILDNVKALGFNTVIVQVRPFGDSFYPSEHYPMSAYAVGAYGRDADYDPFSIIVSEAHLRGLSIHAWINPLRCMRTDELENVSGEYKTKEWFEYSFADRAVEVSGRVYLNPAYPEVRELVCDGVSEIIRNYPVDGIHIDDYFYPTTDTEFDRIAYSRYLGRGGKLSLADFRREQISSLVHEIYTTVKSENGGVIFGVSPSGVMENNYDRLYADVALWCAEEGYVDYICPQVYFGFEHSTCPFDRVCDEFSAMVKNKNVRLIIGLSLGKAEAEYDPYAGEGKYEWRDRKDVLRRSMEYLGNIGNCSGFAFFSYQHFYDPVSGEENERTAAEREGILSIIKAGLTY